MTLNVTQDHRNCLYSIGHTLRQRTTCHLLSDDDYQIETASSIPAWLTLVFAAPQHRT